MKKIYVLCISILFVFLMSCTNTSVYTSTQITTDETITIDYTLLNESFEDDIDRVLDLSWDTFQSDTMYQKTDTQRNDGNSSLQISSLFGGFLSVWQVVPIEGQNYREDFNKQLSELNNKALFENTTMPKNGDKVELSIDVFIDETTNIENTTPFLVCVETENIDGEKTIIAESDVTSVSQGEWFSLTTIPAANNGIIPKDAVLVLVSFQMNIPEDGIIYVDNVHFGKKVSEDEVRNNDNPKYDSLGSQIEIANHSFEEETPFIEISEYSNDAYYGDYSGVLNSNKNIVYEIYDVSNLTPETISAGVWMKKLSVNGETNLTIEAFYDGAYHFVNKAELTYNNVWNYVKVAASAELKEKNIEKIKIIISNNTNDDVLIDFIQVGDFQAINGNPKKLALIAYQPWYASESNGWGNWQYTDASDFDGGVNSYPSRVKDGLRDIASVYYPLIGVYDSSDYEVINYHLDLIKAMNIDVVQVNYYANLSQNMLDSLETIFKLAEKKGLKVSILYEPKIHIYGWIPHNTRMEAISAIEDDIKEFINRYGSSKALLKVDNSPVIEIFGVNILRNTEWKHILDKINKENYNPYLMGDSIQNSDYSSMKGMCQWDLYNSNLSNAGLDIISSHIEKINNETLEWSKKNLGYNIPIGIVYPGFDDSKVLGWDLGKIRKIDQTGPSFYQESWNTLNRMDSFNWVLVATFNDWNEGTIIEPELNWGHAMAVITQKEIAKFKGYGVVDSSLLISITENYLSTRTNNYD